MKKRDYLLWKSYYINLDLKRLNEAVKGKETFVGRATHARRTASKKTLEKDGYIPEVAE